MPWGEITKSSPYKKMELSWLSQILGPNRLSEMGC